MTEPRRVIPLCVPEFQGREVEYLTECIRSTYVSYMGPFVSRFEQMAARIAGAGFGAATSSGTTGLHLALTAAGVVRDDLVIVPSLTFIASANAVSHCGAAPWLLDSDAESWTLSPAALRDALERDTRREDGRTVHRGTGRTVRAVMPVHTIGIPADMDPILDLARGHGLRVVADGAPALGARYKGRPVGGLADLTVFSFNGNKTVTAGGGGVVVGDDEDLVALARHLSATARRPGLGFEHDHVAFNYRMTNLQAAVGCAQLERFEALLESKRRIRRTYDAALRDQPGSPFPAPAWAERSDWFSGVVLRAGPGGDATEICAELREQGIEARPFWKPVHLQTPYRDAVRGPLPVTEDLWRRILVLPCSTGLTEADQSTVVEAVRRRLEAPRDEVRP